MESIQMTKNAEWTGKDVVKVATIFIINVIVLLGTFICTLYLMGRGSAFSLGEYFKNPINFILFSTLTVLVLTVAVFFFLIKDRNFFKVASNSEMIFLTIELGIIICLLSERYINLYARPVAAVAIIILFLTNQDHAIFTNVIFSLILFIFETFTSLAFNTLGVGAVLSPSFNTFGEGTILMIVGLVSGTVAVWCMKNVYSRMKLLVLGVISSIPVLIAFVIEWIAKSETASPVLSVISAALSGVYSVVVAIVLLPILELIFKKVTSFKLAELTDHNSAFLKKMINKAPGTFNHSIVVSQVAEACATAIGEDPLLARTCAYYHDIGKLRRPEFFRENQMEGANPHDDLTAELSANIIKAHSVDGYSLAQKNRFPKEIANACHEHHGTLPIIFFYNKAKKFTDGEVDISKYCYPGPKPQSKISAIIMIADGCEAAVRTLADRSREKVEEVVKKIVQDRMDWQQFDECDITIKELNIIIHTVVNILSGVYHKRVEYPKVNTKKLLSALEAEKEKEDKKEDKKEEK